MSNDDTRAAAAAPRELRLALAMRGGVSLAVWIGGSCCEIDRLRTAGRARGFWERLLTASGYDAVAVDVLAGASAGGLNGVIYAASQQYGFEMDRLRDLWVNVGDTSKLLRTKDDAKDEGWPSLFRGDGYFYKEARKALADLAETATPPEDPPPVTLTLSATLVEPVRRPGRSPSDEPLSQLRFATGFVFKHPDQSWQASDFPHGGETHEPVWSRLALAARTTSSFPAAFEAARIKSARPLSFSEPARESGADLLIDMGGVFTDRGTLGATGGEFIVSDGGILDNIPLGRALEAIAHAAADGPTDRYLLYVQPGAPTAARPQAKDDDEQVQRASFNVLRGLLAARLPNEDIIGDLAELDAYNTRIERAKSLRRSGFQGLLTQQDLLAAASVRWAGYRVLRAEEDERLVSALLDDPLRALGEDPFPAKVDRQDVAQDRWRSPLDAPGAPMLSREQLAVTLTQAFLTRLPVQFPDSESTEGRVVAFGALPLLRITQLLIEWAQYLEGFSREAGPQKKKLYRVAAFVREAIDRPRRLGWVTLAATVPAGKNEQDLRAAAGVLADLMLVTGEEATRVCTALNAVNEDRGVLRSAVQARLQALDSIPGRAWGMHTADESNETDLRLAILRDVLVPIAQTLQALGPQDDTNDDDETRQTYPAAAYLNRVLDGEIGCAALEALEVVAYPEFAAGLPGRRPVKFHRLSAANPTPLAPKFTALLSAAKQRGAWWDPEQTDHDKQQGIHVSLKLAGNDLANFAAFLCDEWRLNDWLWGRLDAVPTLVDLLLASARFRRGPDAQADEAHVQALVVGPPERPSPLRDFLLAEVLNSATVNAAITELASPFGPMPMLRQALIAARQWEILAEELAVSPTGLVDRVAAYNTGAQSIHSPEVHDTIRSRFDAITHVVDDVAIYCAQLQFSNGPLGTPADPTFTGGALRKAIEFLGSLAAKRLTKD